MALLFKICILYNLKFSLMFKCLGTYAIIVTRAQCSLLPLGDHYVM